MLTLPWVGKLGQDEATRGKILPLLGFQQENLEVEFGGGDLTWQLSGSPKSQNN